MSKALFALPALALAGVIAASAAQALTLTQHVTSGLVVGSDPTTWGATAVSVPNADGSALVEGGARSGSAFTFIDNSSGAQGGLVGAGFDLYVARDANYLYVGAVVSDDTVVANAPAWWRRDSVEFRLVADGYGTYDHNGANQDGLFIFSVQRDGTTTPNYGEIQSAGLMFDTWVVNNSASGYTAAARIELTSLTGASAGAESGALRLNANTKNQDIANSNDDLNRVWLAGDAAASTNALFEAQLENTSNWALIAAVPEPASLLLLGSGLLGLSALRRRRKA